MELTGENRIPAPRARVWALLNDADVLRACIPGCESLEGNPTDGFSARVTTKIGPVKATFTGAVALTNVNAPESYTISGEGKGGVAGFAKGGADVTLREDGTDTVLSYAVRAQVGGKLAQLGSRLIDSTAKKLADQFFTCFAERAALPAGEGAGEGTETGPTPPLPVADTVLLQDSTSEAPAGGPDTHPAATPIAAHPAPAGSVVSATEAASPAPGVTTMPLNAPAGAQLRADPVDTGARPPGSAMQDLAQNVGREVKREAAVGFLGGPMVWGLLVILALLAVYVIAT